MATVAAPIRLARAWDQGEVLTRGPTHIILSVDVEEHHRIEAASGLTISGAQQTEYAARVEPASYWLLEQLHEQGLKATFFIVGELAQRQPRLVQAIHAAGHEVASHGWDHRRVHHFTPETFREDLRRSRSTLEQIAGAAVFGYRAPTFSVVRQTAWALDVLAEEGMLYDSSIYPVRHDLYGVPQAPRAPFRARGRSRAILEIPPATLRIFNANLPVGGGGYFRLLPAFLIERALEQTAEETHPSVAMLYFHPWEFDPRQARLPLGRISKFRTYVGLYRSRARLATLLAHQPRRSFARAVDVARLLAVQKLPSFQVWAQ
jgi:polysaccharide deacetylase family protein (PEP-CTERM system associated)